VMEKKAVDGFRLCCYVMSAISIYFQFSIDNSPPFDKLLFLLITARQKKTTELELTVLIERKLLVVIYISKCVTGIETKAGLKGRQKEKRNNERKPSNEI